jgi:glycerophosphoryl diester phosphodiesterase
MSEIPWRWPRRRPGGPVTVFAHRGGSGPWHENSLEAFAGALDAGADGVELDVRRCIDGALVVHHDPEVPDAGLIHELRRRELPGWIPTLDEALAALAGAMVDVEIKNVPTDPGYDPSQKVAAGVATALAAAAGRAPPRAAEVPAQVIVSSFWPDTLVAVAAAVGTAVGDAELANDEDRYSGERAPLGLLVHPAFDAGAALSAAAGLGCMAIHPHHSQVDADLVRAAHDLGLAVLTWTVNGPHDLDAVVGAGVDAVITDAVADTLAHLGRR